MTRIKRDCGDCRALDHSHYGEPRCQLGYRVASVKIYISKSPASGRASWIERPTPQEPCPKPLTWGDWKATYPKGHVSSEGTKKL